MSMALVDVELVGGPCPGPFRTSERVVASGVVKTMTYAENGEVVVEEKYHRDGETNRFVWRE